MMIYLHILSLGSVKTTINLFENIGFSRNKLITNFKEQHPFFIHKLLMNSPALMLILF
mgnify:FL=1